jgi:hypothetical protein
MDDPLPLKPNAYGGDHSEKNHRCIQGEKQGDLIWGHAGQGREDSQRSFRMNFAF